MKNQTKMTIVAVLLLAAGVSHSDTTYGVNMEFVPVESAGFANDSTGYGYVNNDYRIGKEEVSISQFAISGIVDNDYNYWQSLGSDAPVVNITWHQAAQFCNYMTSGSTNSGAYTIVDGLVTSINRSTAVSSYGTVYVLPTENEWYKAAYFKGNGYSTYATGNDTLVPTLGSEAMYSTSTVWTVASGDPEQQATRNMMGNVWEWLESPFDTNSVAVSDNRALRGGAYNQDSARLKRTNNYDISGSASLDALGFRVVAIPEPGTISLMSLSTLSLFVTRTLRRRKFLGKSLFPIQHERLCDQFETYEEQERYLAQMEKSDYLDSVCQIVQEKMIQDWHIFCGYCKSLDKYFWNRMVLMHERRVERKKAFKAKIKKQTLNCFDSFLALFMK